jgi:hypothetical protein
MILHISDCIWPYTLQNETSQPWHATLASAIILCQSSDLPYGSVYSDQDEFREWADAMTEQFDIVEPRTSSVHQKVVLDEKAKDGPIEKLVVSADV